MLLINKPCVYSSTMRLSTFCGLHRDTEQLILGNGFRDETWDKQCRDQKCSKQSVRAKCTGTKSAGARRIVCTDKENPSPFSRLIFYSVFKSSSTSNPYCTRYKCRHPYFRSFLWFIFHFFCSSPLHRVSGKYIFCQFNFRDWKVIYWFFGSRVDKS
jgi:hypothetical protein